MSYRPTELNQKSLQEIETIFQSIPGNFSILDLSYYHLGLRTAAELVSILGFIPVSVTS
jgi:hypothetical protein